MFLDFPPTHNLTTELEKRIMLADEEIIKFYGLNKNLTSVALFNDVRGMTKNIRM